MEKVKAALSDFTHRAGHHDTTVHEAVAPAVQHEVIKPHVHEEVVTAVDKEIHQDHYHRTIQPIKDREVLPETHTAKIGEVQHREFDHRDHDQIKRSLVEDQTKFRDERRVDQTTHSRSVAPTLGGEHVHHHIHETIQPVVEKETIQPNVIHTTVPIHEVHHHKATIHDTTALPPMTMDQFKQKGGVLSGREERYDEFEGVPKNIGGSTAGFSTSKHDSHHGTEHARHGDYNSGTGLTGTHGMHDSHNSLGLNDGIGSTAVGNSHTKANLDHRSGEDSDLPKALTEDVSRAQPHSSLEGHHNGHHTTGQDVYNKHNTIGHNTNVGQGTTGHKSTNGKPSLADKLNPKIDADGDGKAGIMD